MNISIPPLYQVAPHAVGIYCCLKSVHAYKTGFLDWPFFALKVNNKRCQPWTFEPAPHWQSLWAGDHFQPRAASPLKSQRTNRCVAKHLQKAKDISSSKIGAPGRTGLASPSPTQRRAVPDKLLLFNASHGPDSYSAKRRPGGNSMWLIVLIQFQRGRRNVCKKLWTLKPLWLLSNGLSNIHFNSKFWVFQTLDPAKPQQGHKECVT